MNYICPICGSNFVSKSTYSECSNHLCPTFLYSKDILHVDFSLIKELLNSPVLKTNKLAKSFGNFLKDKGFLTKNQLAYIIGRVTPNGTKTLLEIAQDRTHKKIPVGKLYNADAVAEIKKEEQATKKSAITQSTESKPIVFTNTDITIVTGNEEPLLTSDFPYINYTFEKFNPLQSVTANYVVKDINAVIAAPTSSGKTIVAEQFIAPIVASGKKAIYISPLKALTQEKFDDWTDPSHYFSKYTTEILTGDYILSSDRVNKINNADIILLTSEMLDSRTRKIDSEKNEWLKAVGVMVVDEAHLIGMDGRGDNLECAIMRFTEQNKDSKIVFLSATMPNVIELSNWLTYLNGKDSILIKSDWRPIILDTHYVEYEDDSSYSRREYNKVEETYNILKTHKSDKFIVFTHTKAMGKAIHDMVKNRLREEVEFHSADLDKETRQRLEQSFKQKSGGLRILIATSTLAWGINAPARRVIVTGVHRGLSEVTAMEVIQMIGRSGRYGIDVKGDAYILVPDSDASRWKDRISNSENVISRMTDSQVLAFHVISEVVRGIIYNRTSLKEWYKRTLAFFQNNQADIEEAIEEIEEALTLYKAMNITDGVYKATGLGKVSAWMYYHPITIYQWWSGFNTMIMHTKNITENPYLLSMAFSYFKELYPPPLIKDHIEDHYMSWFDKKGIYHPNPTIGYVIHNMITSTKHMEFFLPVVREIKRDIDRITESVKLIDKLYGSWGIPYDQYDKAKAMVQYEIEAKYADICRVKWVGGKKAQSLFLKGIKTVADVANPSYAKIVKEVMGTRTEEAIASAVKLTKKGKKEE